MKKLLAIFAIATTLTLTFGTTACVKNTPSTSKSHDPDKPAECDDSCTERVDTVTVTCIWLGATDRPDGSDKLIGEAYYTVAGIVRYRGTGDVTNGKVYRAWYHNWSGDKYPRISITCDEHWHAGLYCQLKYRAPGDAQAIVIDTQNLGPKAPPGSVTCNTDLWVNQHFNKGERIAPSS